MKLVSADHRKCTGLAAFAALFLAGAASSVLAQDAGGNQVWLGQVGGNNLFDILQDGRNNSAGADNIWLLLGQDGSDNSLVLEQFGYNNKLGTLFADEPAYARGAWQRGNLNSIRIDQSATAANGGNVVGSIQQYSRILGTPAANALRIAQTTSTDIAHYIGRIVQFNASGAEGTDNRVFALQSERDGTVGVGGNILANVRQAGNGNSFGSVQRGQNNRIGDIPTNDGLPIGGAVQLGVRNTAWIVQLGANNAIEYVNHFGRNNASRVFMSGTGNAIFQILQNTESWMDSAVGNRLEVSITGEGNGGGTWIGEFLLPGALNMPGIAQAVLQQLGDDNDIRLTIVQGVDNRFGISQNGDANDAHVSIAAQAGAIDAEDNTSAIFQQGDLNYVRHEITGSNNLGAVAQIGENNAVSVRQDGTDNVAVVRIQGDNNNSPLAAPSRPLLIPGLVVGDLRQSGATNSAEVGITGDANGFWIAQSGEGHRVEAIMEEMFNSLAVWQQGTGQTSISLQIGSGNSLGVHQF